MKKIIEEHKNIIFIALVYNYIANNKTSLTEREILCFIEKTIKNLKNNESNYETLIDSKQDNIDYNIEFDDNKKEYILKSLCDVYWLYNYQPQQIITATLQENALCAIYVDKEQLKIEKKYTFKNGVKDIYSLKAKNAQESVRKILESQGCKNITIGLAIPDQLKGDKGYHVSYICEEPYEKVNVLSKIQKK